MYNILIYYVYLYEYALFLLCYLFKSVCKLKLLNTSTRVCLCKSTRLYAEVFNEI